MERKFSFSENEFYHVYNRGTEKRIIFLDDHDYQRFLMLLFIANNSEAIHLSDFLRDPKKNYLKDVLNLERKKPIVAIGAYCLMPNHFHLLLKEIIEGGISLFMNKFQTGYSMYFNKKHKRSGTLFQGTFRAEHANNDRYLKYLLAYIHLNPIKLIEPNWKVKGISNKHRAKNFLFQRGLSSYLDYMGTKREEGKILQLNHFPKYFLKPFEFENFLNDWLTMQKDYEESVVGGLPFRTV